MPTLLICQFYLISLPKVTNASFFFSSFSLLSLFFGLKLLIVIMLFEIWYQQDSIHSTIPTTTMQYFRYDWNILKCPVFLQLNVIGTKIRYTLELKLIIQHFQVWNFMINQLNQINVLDLCSCSMIILCIIKLKINAQRSCIRCFEMLYELCPVYNRIIQSSYHQSPINQSITIVKNYAVESQVVTHVSCHLLNFFNFQLKLFYLFNFFLLFVRKRLVPCMSRVHRLVGN